MNNIHTLCALALVVVSVPFCRGEEIQFNRLTKEQCAEQEARRLRFTGGMLVKKGTFTGTVVIVNEQAKLNVSNLEAVASMFAKSTRCNVLVADKGAAATVRLTVVDDPKEPIMLLAPEDHWGKVNVSRIVDDLPGQGAKDKFFEARARRLVAKALSLLCGGGASAYPGNLMNAATLRDLDMSLDQIPVDVADRHLNYLKQIGVTPREEVTYRKACREGWAPAPTNEIQKAVWDKVNAAPKTPMKIEFDPKKGR